jgi:hypothetical protein
MALFSKVTKPAPQILRVIHFSSRDWGFTDASMPRVQALLRSLAQEDVDLFHSGITIRFRGEEKKGVFDQIRASLEQLRTLPEFEGFQIGVAAGVSGHPVDDMQIGSVAAKNARA